MKLLPQENTGITLSHQPFVVMVYHVYRSSLEGERYFTMMFWERRYYMTERRAVQAVTDIQKHPTFFCTIQKNNYKTLPKPEESQRISIGRNYKTFEKEKYYEIYPFL